MRGSTVKCATRASPGATPNRNSTVPAQCISAASQREPFKSKFQWGGTSKEIVQEPHCFEATQFFEIADVAQLRTNQYCGVVSGAPDGVRDDANLWIRGE
jgi:hypothetical protein